MPSSALLAAQEKLNKLRRRQTRPFSSSSIPPCDTVPFNTEQCNTAVSPYSPQALPEHLGWHSQAVSYLRRKADAQRQQKASQHNSKWVQQLQQEEATALIPKPSLQQSAPEPNDIKLYPDMALALLRQELVASGRLWLLLRHLDQTGRGWLDLTDIYQEITVKTATYRLCGRRQLRNLLRAGAQQFWERDANGRIWLRSQAKVMASLGIERLQQRPVALPASLLTEGIGKVRAHFYASFHSSRTDRDKNGATKPIARATLRRLSGCSQQSQREYERIAKVKKKAHIALGPQLIKGDKAQIEKYQWQQGGALFTFTDKKGNHGCAGITYLAWQLPNSYSGPHTRLARGQKKRLNKQLQDLSQQGMTGNGRCVKRFSFAPLTEDLPRRFFVDGNQAARQYGRTEEQSYWHGFDDKIWYCLG